MSDRFEHKKSLGQHFLNSDVVPKWLTEAGRVAPGDIVLEIGPGTGALTRALLEAGATVIALEADRRAIETLKETFAGELANNRLILHHTDVRKLNLRQYELNDHGFKVVANIPYYLSGYLFRTILESDLQPSDLVFLVQKEVAKRACSDISRGEKESLLSLSVKVFGEPEYVRTVSKGHFTPPPKIDSGIIAVRNINREQLAKINQNFFFKILHLGFGQKRKQLLGNLTAEFDRTTLTNIFSTLSIPQDARAEDVPLEIWLTLVKELTNHK